MTIVSLVKFISPALIAVFAIGCSASSMTHIRPSYSDDSKQPVASVNHKPKKTVAKTSAPVKALKAPSVAMNPADTLDGEDSLDFGTAFGDVDTTEAARHPKVALAGDQSDLTKLVEYYIGTRYLAGGTTEDGMDCSGFTWRVYNSLDVKDFPRQSAADMAKLGKEVDLEDGIAGDLVYFKKHGRVYHVGIYMGDHRFAHSSLSSGVMYSNLDEEYYKDHFVFLRRVRN